MSEHLNRTTAPAITDHCAHTPMIKRFAIFTAILAVAIALGLKLMVRARC
jgi:hypothetical protein